MAISRQQKEKIIKTLEEKITKQKAMVFVDFSGLKVKDITDLKKKLKTEENEFKVAKKTLMTIVFKNSHLPFFSEIKNLKGEIALVFGYKNEINLAKTVWQFSQEHPDFKILAGVLENKFIETEKIITLAQLLPKEELLAKLVGTICGPISNFLSILQGNIKGLICVLSQIKTEN